MADLSRRAWLAGAGGTVVAVVGGLAWRASDQGLFTPADARPGFRPWRDVAEGRYHGAMALAAAGVLAASPHNTQPWLFHIRDGSIDVHAVPARNLGAFDPFRREMAIALGCAVENMLQAAPGQKLVASATDIVGEPTRVARLALTAGNAPPAELSDWIVRRHTNRHPYDTARIVEPRTLARLRAHATDPRVRLVLMPRDGGAAKHFGELTIAATQTIIEDVEMGAWSHRWTRDSRAEVDRDRSGLTLAGAGLDPLTEIVGDLLPATDARTQSRYWLNMTRARSVPTAAVFGMLLVKDPYDRAQSLAAGRLWQRLHLRGAQLGLAMQPLNQIPEVIDRERQLGQPAAMAARIDRLLTDQTWRPTFGFRLGYPTRDAAIAPRRALADAVET